MRIVGHRLEAERCARIAARDVVQLEAGARQCGIVRCGRVAVTCVSTGGWVCVEHRPRQPVRTCSKPLLCYKPCCAGALPAVKLDSERREQRQHETSGWATRLRAEIEQLAAGRDVFTLAALAEFGRPDRVRHVVDAAVKHELIEKHPRRDEWRGTGRRATHDYVPPPPVDVDNIERENRYQ